MSFHPKSITDLRGGVEKRRSSLRSPKINFREIFRAVRFSTFATKAILCAKCRRFAGISRRNAPDFRIAGYTLGYKEHGWSRRAVIGQKRPVGASLPKVPNCPASVFASPTPASRAIYPASRRCPPASDANPQANGASLDASEVPLPLGEFPPRQSRPGAPDGTARRASANDQPGCAACRRRLPLASGGLTMTVRAAAVLVTLALLSSVVMTR